MMQTGRTLVAFVVAAAAVGARGIDAQAQDFAGYTEDQARAGQLAYESVCASCHMANLQGDFEAPELAGPNFLNRWGGREVNELFLHMQASMPPAGRKPSDESFTDIIAYLLERNGLEAGSARLVATATTRIPTIVENIDEVELQGFELAATWSAAEWLDLFVGGSWIDSEINENRVRPDTVGNESPATPEYTANFSAYLNFPVTSNMNFFTNLNYSLVGETWFHVVQDQVRPTVFNNSIENRIGACCFGDPTIAPEWADADLSKTRRDSYGLLHLRLGLESERWTLAIWGNNATDEEYLEEVITAPEFGGSFIHPGTLSRWGADVTWRFGS